MTEGTQGGGGETTVACRRVERTLVWQTTPYTTRMFPRRVARVRSTLLAVRVMARGGAPHGAAYNNVAPPLFLLPVFPPISRFGMSEAPRIYFPVGTREAAGLSRSGGPLLHTAQLHPSPTGDGRPRRGCGAHRRSVS